MNQNLIRGIYVYLSTIGLVGLLYFIKAKATKSTIFYRINRRDCKHPIYIRIPSSDIPTYRQVFIDKEYKFFVEKQPKTIVDAGANIGLASIYFTNKYPNAKILSIEPEKSNFEILKKNTAFYPNIIPIQAALWHKNGEVSIIDTGLGKWAFMTEMIISSKNNHDSTYDTVVAITIDKIMEDYNLSKIDILKVDIEGAEREVFSDTSSWINKIKSLIVELHERRKPGCNRSFYEGSNGFDYEWMHGENVYLSRGNYLKRTST